MAKRVLFIAYLYPPVGGAGVQRTAYSVPHAVSVRRTPYAERRTLYA